MTTVTTNAYTERCPKVIDYLADEDMPDASETAPEPADEESPPAEPEIAPQQNEDVPVQSGRRRGKRKIMKKKTVKDAEGYLGMYTAFQHDTSNIFSSVTVEEPVWESFSEDEQAPPPRKKPAVSAAGASKSKKAGQGNIMSFFSKK